MSAETLAALAEQLDHLSAPVAAWLRRGLDRWQAGEDLDKALGLRRGRGQRRPETRDRLARRDELIRSAWAAVPEQKPWPRSRALAERIGRLEPAYRRWLAGHPLESEVNRLLCAARDNGPLPESANQVHKIVTATPFTPAV